MSNRIRVRKDNRVSVVTNRGPIRLVVGSQGRPGADGTPGASGGSRAFTARIATLANIALSSVQNGYVHDGVTLATNDVILAWREPGAQVGLYVVPATAGSIARHSSFSNYDDHIGALITVTEGTYAGKVFFGNSPPGGTIGSDPISFRVIDGERCYQTRPYIQEKSVVLFAPTYFYRESEGFTLHSPADGSLYWEVSLNTSNNEARYFFSEAEAVAGNNPFQRVNTTTRPVLPTWDMIDIATIHGRNVTSKFAFTGDTRGGLVSNMFARGNDGDRVRLYNSTTTTVDVTDSELTSLGFLRGVSASASNAAFMSSALPPRRPKRGWFFARVYMETDSTWETPSVFFHAGGENLISGGLPLFLEKILSSTARIYSRMGTYDLGQAPDSVHLGLFPSAIVPVIVGAQAYAGDVPQPYIFRDDFPNWPDAEVLYGPRMFCVEDRPLPIYAPNVIGDRELIASEPRVTIWNDSANADVPYWRSQSGIVDLDLDRLDSAFKMTVHSAIGDPNMRAERDVEKVQSAASVSGSPEILVFGDSVVNRSLLPITDAKLQAIGMTPNWNGFLNNDGLNGEGREGWAAWDFVHGSTARKPISEITGKGGAGTEADYLILSPNGTYGETRHQYNPWIREADGGDDPDHVLNGYIFDPLDAITRFNTDTPGTLEIPDCVVILLGTNDINEQTPANSLSHMLTALEIMIVQCLAISPSVRIGVGLYGLPRSTTSNTKWWEEQVPAIKAIMDKVYEVGGGRTDVVPIWAHMLPGPGWTVTEQGSVSGRIRGRVSDDLHPQGINRQIMGECLAAWIANRSVFEDETEALIGEFDVDPSWERIKLIDALIKGLKADGIWSKLDFLYLLAAHDAQAAKINWIDPDNTNFVLTATNSPTFTADEGFTGNGGTAKLANNVAFNTLTQYQLDSASFGVWYLAGTRSDSAITGADGNGTNGVFIAPCRAGSDVFRSRINDSASTDSTGTLTTVAGHKQINRSGSSATEKYINGAAAGTFSTASTGVKTNVLAMLNVNSTASDHKIAACWGGASLTSDEHSDLHDRLEAYLQAVEAIP